MLEIVMLDQDLPHRTSLRLDTKQQVPRMRSMKSMHQAVN